MQPNKYHSDYSDPSRKDGGQIYSMNARQADYLAFSELYQQYSPALYGFIIRVIGAGELAEQVLHNTFITLYQSQASYQPAKEPKITWMLKIALTTALASMPDVVSDQEATEAEVSDLKCVSSLITMVYFKGLTLHQVAAGMQLPSTQLILKLKKGIHQLPGGAPQS